MWIKTTVFLCCLVATLAADKQPPKKKEDPRGKRNLQYHIAHHTGPFAYRRISTAPQIPLYHSQFFPGPRSYSPYHKDGQNDLLTDNNHLSETVYGPQPHKHIIERPVYIKEPEPIIEIIIKESNVTLPPPPAPPAPPPKKKEQVQVFYVKYKKNPNGHGKDSIIYDKPIAAISPPIHDEQEEAPPPSYHQEVVTHPPPPSTTLRTIIKPDSETYHSPSGVKVTFGKEGFDYDKRSNKAADLKAAEDENKSVQFPHGRQLAAENENKSVQFPQGRQLAAFPPRRPEIISFTPPPGYRQPQPYRPFTQFRQQTSHSFPRPSQQQYATLPKFPQFSQPGKSFPPPRPAPPQFQRQPVPYQPFDGLRHPQFRPETHFPITQAPPITQKPVVFNQRPQISDTRPQITETRPQISNTRPQISNTKPQISDPRPQISDPRPQISDTRPQITNTRPQISEARPQFTDSRPQVKQKPQFEPQVRPQFPQQFPQYHQTQSQLNQFHPSPQPQQPPQYQQQRPTITQPNQYQFQQFHQQQALPLQHQQPQPFNAQPSIIPPGGELIHSVPKYEQHISVSEPFNSPQSRNQPQYQLQPQPQQSSIKLTSDTSDKRNNQHQQTSQSQSQYQPQPSYDKVQQQLRDANAFQESIRNSNPQYYNFQQSQQLNYFQTSPKPSSTTTKTTTTTTTTVKPSTTTKDPKLLNAQLPDEVPDDLREQLLSSGILNNADISILDYDKVGDIPLSALPPDQLANFYNAGGAQQIQTAGSAPVPVFAARDFDAEGSEVHEVTVKPEVQMKVVRYDPESYRGQQVQEAYVKDDATQVEPVVLNDEKYNRYLPLKISGTQFPIPDVPELKGKKITSVVVLAPIAYDFSSSRRTREATNEEIELLEGQLLKDLLKNPSKENFKKFLENENRTRSDQQAVILLVAGPNEDTKDKEIFMYDIATRTVSKLDGELSSAFVDAAEANSSDDDTDVSASSIVETRVPYEVPIIDPQADLEADGSEHLESFVDVSGIPVGDDLTTSESHRDYKVLGISKTGRLS